MSSCLASTACSSSPEKFSKGGGFGGSAVGPGDVTVFLTLMIYSFLDCWKADTGRPSSFCFPCSRAGLHGVNTFLGRPSSCQWPLIGAYFDAIQEDAAKAFWHKHARRHARALLRVLQKTCFGFISRAFCVCARMEASNAFIIRGNTKGKRPAKKL